MSSSKIKWLTLIVVVFIIGGALGFVGGESYQRHLFHQFHPNQPPPPNARNRGDFQKRLLDELKKDLALSEDQTKKIADIFTQVDQKYEGDRERRQAEREQRMKSMREEVDTQINAVLSPEQKIKFVEFQKKFDQERQTRESRWGRDTTSTSRDTTLRKGN
jgi:periplasmic protein CpxP/Spy